MWIAPKAYMATLLARGKSQEYIDRIMVAPNPGTVLLFIASIVIGALVGALIGQALSKKNLHRKSDQLKRATRLFFYLWLNFLVKKSPKNWIAKIIKMIIMVAKMVTS